MIAWGVAAFFMIAAMVFAYLYLSIEQEEQIQCPPQISCPFPASCPPPSPCPASSSSVGLSGLSGDQADTALVNFIGISNEGFTPFRESFVTAQQITEEPLKPWVTGVKITRVDTMTRGLEFQCTETDCTQVSQEENGGGDVDFNGKLKLLKVSDQDYALIYILTLDEMRNISQDALSGAVDIASQGAINSSDQENFETLKKVMALFEWSFATKELFGFSWSDNTFRLAFPLKKIGPEGNGIKFKYNLAQILKFNPVNNTYTQEMLQKSVDEAQMHVDQNPTDIVSRQRLAAAKYMKANAKFPDVFVTISPTNLKIFGTLTQDYSTRATFTVN